MWPLVWPTIVRFLPTSSLTVRCPMTLPLVEETTCSTQLGRKQPQESIFFSRCSSILFHPEQLISGTEDAQYNFARGWTARGTLVSRLQGEVSTHHHGVAMSAGRDGRR